jgi:Spy/CpxP family protein refolding chaperone
MRTALMLVLGMAVALSASAAAGDRVPWDEQNRVMGYLILHLSNVNLVNGLNLTREQAVALREIARKVEAASPAAPTLTGAFRADLAEVRDTYVEVRRRLLAGEAIDEALRKRVGEARKIESAVVRLSLTEVDAGRTGCARCHQPPAVGDVRALAGKPYASEVRQSARTAAQRKAVFLAHQEGIFGKRGVLAVALAAGKVDRVLTSAQKEGLTDFSCCLTPPKSLTSMRFGQAEGGEEAVEILRRVRQVPDVLWPMVRERALVQAEEIAVVITPGADRERKAGVREKVRDVYERARALDDVDFEIDRHTLAAELTQAARPQTEQTDRQRRYMAAWFLTIPGAVDVYDALLQRMDREVAAVR